MYISAVKILQQTYFNHISTGAFQIVVFDYINFQFSVIASQQRRNPEIIISHTSGLLHRFRGSQ
jgi:hypothetical protein